MPFDVGCGKVFPASSGNLLDKIFVVLRYVLPDSLVELSGFNINVDYLLRTTRASSFMGKIRFSVLYMGWFHTLHRSEEYHQM